MTKQAFGGGTSLGRVLGIAEGKARDTTRSKARGTRPTTRTKSQTLRVDQTVRELGPIFASARGVTDIAVVGSDGEVLARMPLTSLATELMRIGVPRDTTRYILKWAARNGTYWCADHKHFTTEKPCKG